MPEIEKETNVYQNVWDRAYRAGQIEALKQVLTLCDGGGTNTCKYTTQAIRKEIARLEAKSAKNSR